MRGQRARAASLVAALVLLLALAALRQRAREQPRVRHVWQAQGAWLHGRSATERQRGYERIQRAQEHAEQSGHSVFVWSQEEGGVAWFGGEVEGDGDPEGSPSQPQVFRRFTQQLAAAQSVV